MEGVETDNKKPKGEKSLAKKKGERRTLTRNRKPLADCTNTLPPSSSSSSSTSTNNAITKLLSSSVASIKTPIPIKPPTKPPPPPSSSSTLKLPNDSDPNPGGDEGFEPRSVYSRRRNPDARKSIRGKEIAAVPKHSFSASLNNQAATGYKSTEDESITVSKSPLTKPSGKRQRQEVKKDAPNHGLPSDFIKEQKAYFAEIDAYELLQEEVASVDELD